MKNCEFAYKKPGDVSVHCKIILEQEEAVTDYCPYQYLCNRSRKWEVSPSGRTCRIRISHTEDKE